MPEPKSGVGRGPEAEVATGAERPPEEVGVSGPKLARALATLDRWVEQGKAPGVAAVVVRRGEVVARHFRGSAAPGSAPGAGQAIGPETIFPLSSIAQPIAAAALLLLVEAGEVLLDDPVATFVPEFGKGGKEQVRVRQLLTHTSGLPDMVSNNEALRKAHSDLRGFVRSTCRAELAFTPGTRVSYSSLGFLMAAEVVERVAREPFPSFVAERVLGPLGLASTALCPSEALDPRIARVRLPEGRAPTTWDVNSPYWRRLGAPWGGLFGTAADLARFGQACLEASLGRSARPPHPERVVGLATARLMAQSQTRGLGNLSGAPEAWGLGWALPAGQTYRWAGDLASPETFGQAGPSGVMLWVDPAWELVCVVLTNQSTNWSTEHRRFAGFSNALQAAVIG